MKNYYIGLKKIKGTIDSGKRTPLGDMIYEITYDGGTKELVSAKRLELCRSDKPLDPTSSQAKFINPVASMVFGVLHEYDLKLGEVNAFATALVTLVNHGIDKAEKIVWGTEEFDRTLNQVNEILLNNAKENKDGASQ